jgi:hypothetical protein
MISLILVCFVWVIFNNSLIAQEIPAGLETVRGDDGSLWERVSDFGFGSDNNISVVAMEEYQGSLFAMTRNEIEGGEIWKTAGDGWEQVLFPGGATNGIYGNVWNNNVWGEMVVFKDKLYCCFSAGLQGTVLKSTGCEIWRYDGTSWEPIISDKKDSEESGTITALSGCDEDDGDVTAMLTDETKNWLPDQWAGGVVQITSGNGKYRRFDIIANTETTLTIQQNEVAGNVGSEYTICESKHYANPFPVYEYDLGTAAVGDAYEIGTGYDENGFGNYWNKSVTDVAIYNNKLYVSTGLNYEYGSQVWYSENGDDWQVTQPPYNFGLYHTDPNYPNGLKGVCSSIPSLGVSSVSGVEVLYAGGQGTTGNLGKCSRVAKLTETGWELIVDTNVDDNDTGTNENGFGGGLTCDMQTGNAMPWCLVDFKGKLYAGINSLGGARILYSPNGGSEDGSWFYSVGGESSIPNGFDGVMNGGLADTYQNVSVNLFSFNQDLYAGLISTYAPAMGATEAYLTGSHVWKSSDGINWKPVTTNGFGDNYIISFEAFATFADSLYVSGSRGASSAAEGLGGAKIFRLLPGKCFIASAAYGNDQADDVILLRKFRNHCLLTNGVGRTFVNLYYKVSPLLARYVAKHEVLKVTTKIALKPLVYSLKHPLSALLALIIGGLIIIRKWK